MTAVTRSRRPPHHRPGRARRILRAVAVVSCVPYLGLKTAWIAGSHVGIPEGTSPTGPRR
ncbi:hypothetical protein [Streptomyces tuirus]